MTHFESVPATHSNQWLVLTDNEGLVVHASEAFCNAAGHPPEQLLGQPIAILRHPDMPKGPIADLWETLGRGESWMGMLKNRRADGSDFWVDAYISPIQAADGQVLEYQAIYRDPDPEIIRRTQRVYRIRSQGRQPSELRWPRLSAPLLQTLLASLAFLPLAVLAFRQAPLTAGLLFLLGIVLSGCALCWHGRALARLVNHCRSLVSHPIKQLIYTGRTDAVGQIELAMRLLTVRLEVMVARIHDSSQQVAGHVAQVSDLLDLSSTASLGQQSALQAIAAAVEEFTATIREVAANTHTAAACPRTAWWDRHRRTPPDRPATGRCAPRCWPRGDWRPPSADRKRRCRARFSRGTASAAGIPCRDPVPVRSPPCHPR